MNFEEGVYYFKRELIDLCKELEIPYSGFSKLQLETQIKAYLKTGRPLFKSISSMVKTNRVYPLVLDGIISPNYKNDLKHREFFQKYNPKFKYNIRFLAWIKENKGKKTYKEALDFYNETKDLKNEEIAPQFEYNTYIRDFFKAFPDKTREDAIKCWNYKKNIKGNHAFEVEDVKVLIKT